MSTKLNMYRGKVAQVINDYVRRNGYDEVMHYSQIRKILSKILAGIDIMFQESDMCYNKTNKANMRTFSNDVLIFESTDKRGYYRILGENYPYNGLVIWARKGNTPDVTVGKWINGSLEYWGEKTELDDSDYDH